MTPRQLRTLLEKSEEKRQKLLELNKTLVHQLKLQVVFVDILKRHLPNDKKKIVGEEWKNLVRQLSTEEN